MKLTALLSTRTNTFSFLAGLLISGFISQTPALATSTSSAYDLGNVMFVGDSITHGGSNTSFSGLQSSYRWHLHKTLADNGLLYNSVGPMTGNWNTGDGTIDRDQAIKPGTVYGGSTYTNIHASESGARADSINGDSVHNKFGYSDIKNWLGQDDIKNNGEAYTGTGENGSVGSVFEGAEAPSQFFLMIGTNDGVRNNEAEGVTLLNDVQGIVGTMLTSNANAAITLMSVPVSLNAAGSQYVQTYNANLKSWVAEHNANNGSATDIVYVDINRGMRDVKSNSWVGHRDLFRDALHPSDQGSIVMAATLAKANGWAGRTAGQNRKGSGDLQVNFHSSTTPGVPIITSQGLIDAGFSLSSGVTVVNNAITLSHGDVLTYQWGDTTNLLDGFTVDFSLDMGNGATDGWSNDYFSLSVGDAGVQGQLTINESYIMWDGKVLFSEDVSTIDDVFRLSYISGENANGLESGFYLWMGDMLIGEALQGTSGSLEGVEFSFSGNSSSTLTDIAVDGTQSYAPSTDGLTNIDGAYKANPDAIPAGPSFGENGTVLWKTEGFASIAAGVNVSTDGVNLISLATPVAGAEGSAVSITVTETNFTSTYQRGYANIGNHTGDIWIDFKAANAKSWWGGQGPTGTLSGDLFMRFSGEGVSDNAGAVVGTMGGTIDGDAYIEFSAANFIYNGHLSSSTSPCIVGSWNGNITGSLSMVFNAGTFTKLVIGGIYTGDKTISGGVNMDFNGGIFNTGVYGGGLTGTIGTDSSALSNRVIVDLNVRAGEFKGKLYAGGIGGTIKGSTSLTITGGSFANEVYAGGQGGTITGNSMMTIKGHEAIFKNGENWVNLSSAGSGGIIQGDSIMTIVDLGTSGLANGFDKYQGTLSGGDRAQVSGTRTLVLSNVNAQDFAPTLVNFDKLELQAQSNFKVNNATDISSIDLVFSGGSTLNLGSNANQVLAGNITVVADDTMFNGGTITSDTQFTLAGNITLNGNTLNLAQNAIITGSLVMNNAGGNLVVAAGKSLTFQGVIDMIGVSAGNIALNLGSSDISFVGATLDLSDMASGSYNLFTSDIDRAFLNPDGSINSDMLSIIGRSGRDSITWIQNGFGLSFELAVITAELAWQGGNGVWANIGSAEWIGDAADNRFYDNDNVTFGGAGIAGGTISLVGDIRAGSILVQGAENFIFAGEGSLIGSSSLIMNGSGTLSLNTTNSYEGGTQLNSGILELNAANAAGSGGISIADGARLELNAANAAGSGGIQLAAGARLQINHASGLGTAKIDNAGGTLGFGVSMDFDVSLLSGGSTDLNYDLAAGITVNSSNNSTLGSQKLNITGGAGSTFVHDSFNSITSANVAEGTTLRFTGHDGSTTQRSLTGGGNVVFDVTRASAVYSLYINASAFSGKIVQAGNQGMVILTVGQTAKNRFSVETTNNLGVIFGTGGNSTVYLSGLSGNGLIDTKYADGNRNFDLELDGNCEFGGTFGTDLRTGKLIVSSGTNSEADGKYSFTMSGTGYNADRTVETSGHLIVQKADVIISNTAVWKGRISLDHSDATLTYKNLSADYDRSATQGSITGIGSVIIENSNVSFSGSNSYSGGTTIESGSLTINNAQGIGSGELTINGGSVNLTVAGIANDVIFNAGSIDGLENLTGNLTMNGGNITLDSAIGGDAGSLITINGGTLNLGSGLATVAGTESGLLGNRTVYVNGDATSYGTLNLNNYSVNNTIHVSGYGKLTNAGSYTGNVNVEAGSSVNLSGDSSASVVLGQGSSVELEGNFSQTGGSISGSGSVDVISGSEVKLDGPNSYSGGTIITGGMSADQTTTLHVASDTALGDASVDTNSVTATGFAQVIVEANVTVDNTINLSEGALIVAKGAGNVDNITVRTNAGSASSAVISGISSNKIDSAVASNATITLRGSTIVKSSSASLLALPSLESGHYTMTDLTLANGSKLATLAGTSNASLTATNVVIEASVAAGTLLINPNAGDIVIDGVTGSHSNYSISSLGDVATVINGSLTLTLTLTAAEYTQFTTDYSNLGTLGADQFLAITVDSLSDLDMWYNDVVINVVDGNGQTITLNPLEGTKMDDGSYRFVVPEPSSVTLSLLALAGLAARRRRKQA